MYDIIDALFWYVGVFVLSFVVPMVFGAITIGAGVFRQLSVQDESYGGIIKSSIAYSAGTWFGTSYIANKEFANFIGFSLGGMLVTLYLAWLKHPHTHPAGK